MTKEFRESRFAWHEYDRFTSSDPEAWDDLKRRRKKLADPIIRWLKEEHQLFSERETDRNALIGLLLRIPVMDDELTVRPEGSLIQYAIDEGLRKKNNSLPELRAFLYMKISACRMTYMAARDKHPEEMLI